MPNKKAFDYKSFFENIPNVYCVTDFDLQIIDANKAFFKLFEVNILNDLAVDFQSLLAENTFRDNQFSVLNKLNTHQFCSHLALEFNTNVLVNWQFTVDRANNLIYISGTVIESNDEVTLLPNNKKGEIGGWEYVIETEELWWSEEVYHIHEEELDKPIEVVTAINYYYNDDIPIISELFKNLLENGIAYDEELRILTAKGNVRWVRAIGKQVLEDGKVYKIQGNFLDVHRQKLAELELQKNKILLQKILDSLPVGVFWKDENGVYSGFNKKSVMFLHTTIDDLLGKKDEEIIKDEILLNQIKKREEEIFLYKKSFSETRTVKINEEEYRTVDIKKLPLINENGEVFGILGVFIDTTQLTTLVNSLKRKNNELRELLFAVSHDLKEPLNGINRFAQLLKKRHHLTLEADGNQILEYILREAHRQYLQFNGLARLLEIGNDAQEISLISLNDVVAEAINNMEYDDKLIPNFEITLNHIPNLKYYRYDLLTVFQELIKNAIKFRQIGNGLKVEISAKEEEKTWKIIVSDNGEGFDMRFKDKVFIIFQKLHNKNYYDGVGIGLSICKKIVEHYGGEINVESTSLNGMSVSFTIPKTII
jgi:signal transduction histidine kinase